MQNSSPGHGRVCKPPSYLGTALGAASHPRRRSFLQPQRSPSPSVVVPCQGLSTIRGCQYQRHQRISGRRCCHSCRRGQISPCHRLDHCPNPPRRRCAYKSSCQTHILDSKLWCGSRAAVRTRPVEYPYARPACATYPRSHRRRCAGPPVHSPSQDPDRPPASRGSQNNSLGKALVAVPCVRTVSPLIRFSTHTWNALH